MTARILPEAGVAPALVRNITLGFDQLAKSVDLGAMTVHMSIDRSIPTADTWIVPGGLELRVNDLYYADVMAGPHPDDPAYLGMHEGLHAFFSLQNPEFARWTSLTREGDGFQRYFFGPHAQAAYGGPIPIDEHGHLLGHTTGDIMSGVPNLRDHPQALSTVDVAVLTDVAVHVWSSAERLVNTVYHEVLHRAPDPGGMAYWTGELESGAVGEWDFWAAVISGAQGDDAVHLVGVVS
jgi:hypothetical protein